MFIIVSNQLFKMFLLILVGVICSKSGLVTHEGNKVLSNVLLMVINPFMILNSFQEECTPELLRGFLLSILLGFIVHGAAIVIGQLLIRRGEDDHYLIDRISIVYANCGFMGIPLIYAVLGSKGVIYLTAFMLVFNVLVWTHGLVLMTGNFSLKQLKTGLTSPVIFSIIIGFILFVGHIRLPEILSDSINYLGVMNTGMGMLVAGAALAESDLLHAIRRPHTYVICALRLIILPLITLAFFAFLPVSRDILFTLLIASACPTATTCIMFALRYGRDEKYASELFAITTLLSIVTIPAVIFIAERVL